MKELHATLGNPWVTLGNLEEPWNWQNDQLTTDRKMSGQTDRQTDIHTDIRTCKAVSLQLKIEYSSGPSP